MAAGTRGRWRLPRVLLGGTVLVAVATLFRGFSLRRFDSQDSDETYGQGIVQPGGITPLQTREAEMELPGGEAAAAAAVGTRAAAGPGGGRVRVQSGTRHLTSGSGMDAVPAGSSQQGLGQRPEGRRSRRRRGRRGEGRVFEMLVRGRRRAKRAVRAGLRRLRNSSRSLLDAGVGSLRAGLLAGSGAVWDPWRTLRGGSGTAQSLEGGQAAPTLAVALQQGGDSGGGEPGESGESGDGCLEEEKVVEVVKEWTPADERPFSVRTLTMDPTHRRTGLPIHVWEWSPREVFVVTTHSPGGPYRKLLVDLDIFFASVGLRYTQVMRPRNVNDGFLAKYAPLRPAERSRRKYPVKPHEVMYSLAQIELWAHVVANRLPYALVFEDDTFIKGFSPEQWRLYFEQVLRQLNLLVVQNGNRFFFDIFYLARRSFHPFAERQLTSNIVAAGASQGTHGYIITYAGAKKLLSMGKLDRPIAEYIGGIPGTVFLAADPPFLTSLMYLCRNPPCRKEPVEVLVRATLTACERTMFVEFPRHPMIADTVIVADYSAQALGPTASPSVDLSYLPGGGGECGTVAQCLIRHRLEELRPPPVYREPREWYRTMPPKLSMWPVFVIGLAGDVERFASLQPTLEVFGFGAVTKALGVNMSATDLGLFAHVVRADHKSYARTHPSWTERKAEKKFLSKGEVGCALSHYLVWLEIVARGLPFAIVLEDDVKFLTENFKKDFRGDFERNVREANSVISREANPLRPDIVLLGKLPHLSSDWAHQLTEHVWHSPLAWCTYAYIITLEGARKLVDGFLVDDPLDSLWWRKRALEFWAFEPNMASHFTAKEKRLPARFSSRVQESDRKW